MVSDTHGSSYHEANSYQPLEIGVDKMYTNIAEV